MIIGFRYGELRAMADEQIILIVIIGKIYLNSRTKQEEMRLEPENEKSSFLLSTETCIYIHASLISCLLLVLMAR